MVSARLKGNAKMKPDGLKPDPSQLVLVIIDVQERLAPAMPDEPLKKLVRNTNIWIEASREFHFPVIFTEQYPKGLGSTIPEIRSSLAGVEPVEKICFSSWGEEKFTQALKASKARQAVVCGMETHVCVYQTVLDFLEDGMLVYLPADAVCSRTKFNWKNGLHLMQNAGAVVGNTETFIFQMLEAAGTDRFKKFSRLFR
jgi:nicotinamidase-related amidase